MRTAIAAGVAVLVFSTAAQAQQSPAQVELSTAYQAIDGLQALVKLREKQLAELMQAANAKINGWAEYAKPLYQPAIPAPVIPAK